MAGLFLRGPFFIIPANEDFARAIVKEFFEARGSAAKSNAKIRIKIGRKAKFKFAGEPLRVIGHT